MVRSPRASAALWAASLALAGLSLLPPTAAHATERPCTILGTSGNDVLVGTPGTDVVCGLGGDDRIKGGGGDDLLVGGPGDDRLAGGEGDDSIKGGVGDDTASGGPGDDVMRGGRGNDVLKGADTQLSPDELECGPGGDRAVADIADVVTGSCDEVIRPDAPTDVTLAPSNVAENRPPGTLVGQLTAVDPDAGDTHTFTLVPGAGAADNASFSIDQSSLRTTAPFDFETRPTLSLRVRATDADGLTFEKTLTVTVTNVSENPPVAVDDSYSTVEDTTLDRPVSGAGSPAANDTDVDGDALTVTAVSGASGGTASISGGQVHFAPTADLCGAAAGGFDYTVSDGGGTDLGHVTLDVTCVPDDPTAVDDSATVAEDSAAAAVAVLANDTDPDGGPKSIASVTQPTNGTVAITGGGTGLTYAPTANYCNDPGAPADDTFTYTLTPGGDTATVSMVVTCVDDAPVAVDDSATVAEASGVTAVLVLANDTDPDGGPKSIASVTQPTNGTVAITGGGTGLTYAPTANYCNDPGAPADDTFTYTLTPGGDTATVSMVVTCVDDAPVAVDDAATVTEDDAATAVAVLTNDTDVDGGPKSVGSVTQPTNGTVAITGGGTGLTYKPNANYCNDPGAPADDTFTYTLTPGTSTGTVSVVVTCVDDAPVAVDDSATVTEDAAATAVTVLTNDTDVDGGTQSIVSVTQPANGTVAITGGGTGLTYKPNASYCNAPPGTAPDTFTYTLTPGADSATVSVAVTCVDDDPVAFDDTASVAQDDPASAVDVLANDTDVDSGPKSIASVTQPVNGTVVITGSGSGLTYEPDAGYCNEPGVAPADTFTYTLDPGADTATVSVTVLCPDAPPTAVADTGAVAEDAAATAIDVLANDTDTDGGPKSVGSVTQPTNGTVAITGGGTGLTYKPNANYCNNPPGTTLDSFTYVLAPGGDSATVTITVSCVDDAPVAVDDAATVTEDDAAAAVAVLANDTDVDGGAKSIGSVTQPTNGTVAITGGGTGLTYKPNANYCNEPGAAPDDTFTYTLSPGGASATVSMTVTCVDDPPVVADSAGPTGYTENDAATVVDAGVTVTNADGVAITGGSVGITGSFQSGQDVLDWTDNDLGDTITEGASTSQTVVLTGAGTAAAYQAALRAVTYVNTSEAPSTSTRTVTFSLTTAAGTPTDTIAISVAAVDDAPVSVDDTATVLEDAAATAVAVLTNDTDVDAGPKAIASVTGPANGTVLITGGGSGLTYKPNANYCNDPPGTTPDTFTYTLNGGSTATVSMTVTCVNDAPVADDEAFTAADSAVGNTSLVGNDPTDGAPATPDPTDTAPVTDRPHKTITADILAGDTDVESSSSSLTVTPGTFASNDGGTVTVQADGDFVFEPAPATSCTDTSDFFDYTLNDNDAGGNQTDTGRVSVAITGCVWYVDNGDAQGNNGTSEKPFDSLAQAETASSANQTVFVYDGDDTTTGYAAGFNLKAGQRLIGEAAALTVGTDTLHAADAANKPTITDNNADVVDLDDGTEVRGFRIDPQGTGSGIAGAAGDTGGGTVDDVDIVDTGTAGTQPGLELDATAGTFTISNLTVNNSAATAPPSTAIGVRLNGAGTVGFVSTGTVSVTTAGAKGLDATGTNMGTGSVFDAITVTGSGTGGVSLVNTTGTTTLGDGAGTDLDLTTTSGATAALTVSNGGTVSVPAAGTANLSATGGPAADITGTSGATFSLDAVSSTNSANDGINLDGLGTGTFSATSGAVGGEAGIGFDLNAGSGAITYPATFNNGSGALVAEVTGRTGGVVSLAGNMFDTNDTGGGVNIANNTGGSTVFSGATKQYNTQANDAVTFSNSDGHTFVLSGGGTDIDTTSGNGVNATTSGTFQVSGSGNTLDASALGAANRGLSIVDTDIASADVTFQRISTSGGTSGIVLTNTGTATGALAVTGIGGTCSSAANCTGGAIQGSTGPGVNLTTMPGGVSLTRVAVTAGGDDGIRATTVNDIDLADSVVLNNGNNHTGGLEERGLDYLNVTGTPDILRTTVSGSDDSNANIRNTVAGTTTLGVNNSTFSDSKFNAGLRLRGEGPSVMNATVQNSIFSLNADPGFSMQTDSANTAQQTLLLTANSFSGGSSNAVSGRPQVSINSDSASVVKATISNNQVKSAAGAEIIVNSLASQTAAGSLDAKVMGNTINDAQPGNLDAPVDGGTSIWGWAHGDGATRIEVRNNVVANWGGRALELSHNDGNGTADFTVTGNTFSNPDVTANTFEGMYILAGGAAGDTSNVCVDLENNDFDGIGRQGVSDIALDRFAGVQLRFADFNDTSVPNLQTNLQGKNPASPALTVETFSNGPTATTASSCTLTSGTP
jgi:cadherin-like protein/Big-like domain-containing protein/cadherin domain-containing protein/hemolysin type calcium-binding protein